MISQLISYSYWKQKKQSNGITIPVHEPNAGNHDSIPLIAPFHSLPHSILISFRLSYKATYVAGKISYPEIQIKL